MDAAGYGFEGKELSNPDQHWQLVREADGGTTSWYENAVAYWDKQAPTEDGVLGGYGHLTDMDVRDSTMLLLKVMKWQLEAASKGLRKLTVLDCGAGMGRVTENLLLHHFHEVDLLEPSSHLLETARRNLVTNRRAAGNKAGAPPADHMAVNFYCTGLQQHSFEPARYDCIWFQWCLLYLTDEDLLSLLHRTRAALKPDGFVMVKENICKTGFVVDDDDSSLTRSNQYMLQIFERAGLKVLYNVKQKNFPKEIFEVRMYALSHRDEPLVAAAAAAAAAAADASEPHAAAGAGAAAAAPAAAQAAAAAEAPAAATAEPMAE